MASREKFYGVPFSPNAQSAQHYEAKVFWVVPESVAKKHRPIVDVVEILSQPPAVECPALAKLADEIEGRRGKRRNCVIRLLRLMASQKRATFEELRQHVHNGYAAADATVEGNVRDTQAEIGKAELPFELSTSEFAVHRIDKIK
jgi:hypothetical protein